MQIELDAVIEDALMGISNAMMILGSSYRKDGELSANS